VSTEQFVPTSRADRGPRRRRTAEPVVAAAVFDLGGVLIDWDPRHLYRQLFPGDEAAMEDFLARVTTQEWNAMQDAGRPWSEAVASLTRAHPDHRDLIAAYRERWDEMLGGPIEPVVDILGELHDAGLPLYALSNWSAETFPVARSRYGFLEWFSGIVISGEIRVAKPDPRAFRHLLDAFQLDPATTVFIDDSPANVEAAREIGMIARRFVEPERLRVDLAALGLPVRSAGTSPARHGS